MWQKGYQRRCDMFLNRNACFLVVAIWNNATATRRPSAARHRAHEEVDSAEEPGARNGGLRPPARTLSRHDGQVKNRRNGAAKTVNRCLAQRSYEKCITNMLGGLRKANDQIWILDYQIFNQPKAMYQSCTPARGAHLNNGPDRRPSVRCNSKSIEKKATESLEKPDIPNPY